MINFAAKKSREMLASYLTPIVEGYANKYFSNLPDLQLSLWSGDIVLQNIAVRVQALEEELQRMSVPITLKSGFIQELRVHIPWTALTSESVEIWINSIKMEASSVERSDATATSGPVQASRKLTEEVEEEEGWVRSLVRKIKHNLILHVKDIDITYTDSDASAVASITCKQLSSYPTDKDWLKTFLDITPQTEVRRACQVHALSLSVSECSNSNEPATTWPIVRDINLDTRVYLTPQATGLDESADKEIAARDFDIRRQRIDVHTDSLPTFIHVDQYRQIMDIISNYKRRIELTSATRDKESISASAQTDSIPNAQQSGKGWFSWAWDIMVEDEPQGEKERLRASVPPTEISFSFFARKASLSLYHQPLIQSSTPPQADQPFGCFSSDGFAVSFSSYKNMERSKTPQFYVGMQKLLYNSGQHVLISTSSSNGESFEAMPHSLFWNDDARPDLADVDVWDLLNAATFSMTRTPLERHISDLVIGIPNFQPPLFTHLRFSFAPLTMTYDEVALKDVITFFTPATRASALHKGDTPKELSSFLRHLWLSAPPVVFGIQLSRTTCSFFPGCRQHTGSFLLQHSLLVSFKSMHLSNADSFPSIEHFATPPTFDSDAIFNCFELRVDELAVSIIDSSDLQTFPVLSPASGKLLLKKSLLGDMHTFLTNNAEPYRHYIVSTANPIAIKIAKSHLSFAWSILANRCNEKEQIDTTFNSAESSLEISLGPAHLELRYFISSDRPMIHVRFKNLYITGWGYPLLPGTPVTDSPILLLNTLANRHTEDEGLDALDFSMHLSGSVGAHLRLRSSGLSMVYNHVIHDWGHWLADLFFDQTKAGNPDAECPSNRSAERDCFLFRNFKLGQFAKVLHQKVEHLRLKLDIDIQNTYLAVTQISHDERITPSVLSIHLPLLAISSPSPLTYRLVLRGPEINTLSDVSASLFATFVRHIPSAATSTSHSPTNHRLWTDLQVDADLIFSPSKIGLAIAIEGGHSKLTKESLYVASYHLISLMRSLNSFRGGASQTFRQEPLAKVESMSKPTDSQIDLDLSASIKSFVLDLIIGQDSVHELYHSELKNLELSLYSELDLIKAEIVLESFFFTRHSQAQPLYVHRLISMPATTGDSGTKAPHSSLCIEARWSHGTLPAIASERVEGSVRESAFTISPNDLSAISSILHETLSHTLSTAETIVTAKAKRKEPRAMLHRAMSALSINVDIGRTEVKLVDTNTNSPEDRSLLCTFNSVEIRSTRNKNGEIINTEHMQHDDNITLKVFQFEVLERSSVPNAEYSDISVPAVSRVDLKLNIKMQRKGRFMKDGQHGAIDSVATNMDIILSAHPTLHLVTSHDQIRIILAIVSAFRMKFPTGHTSGDSISVENTWEETTAHTLSIFFSLPEISVCLLMDKMRVDYLRLLVRKWRGSLETRSGPSPSAALRLSFGHISIDRSTETNLHNPQAKRFMIFGPKSQVGLEKPIISVHWTHHLRQGMDSKWLVIETQPFCTLIDAPLVRCLSLFGSLGTHNSSTPTPFGGKKKQSTMGLKVFMTGIEILGTEDLASPSSIPIRAFVDQFFISTQMDTDDESRYRQVGQPSMHRQNSQVYDATVVGLEFQIPRINSYIIHPCDFRIALTHRLASETKNASFKIEVSTQEIIARLGNSHLVALSQLCTLASAVAFPERPQYKRYEVPSPDGNSSKKEELLNSPLSSIPQQYLLINKFKMAAERNRRPSASEITFSDDQSKECWMTWKYEEARCIKHVLTSPLPGHAKLDMKPLECQLRYWDELKETYVCFATFYMFHNTDAVKKERHPLVQIVPFDELVPAHEWQVYIIDGKQALELPPSMLILSLGVDDIYSTDFEPKVSFKASVVKAQCSLFTQLTVNDQQEDFAIIHLEDGVMRTARWPNATMKAFIQANTWIDNVIFRDLTQRHLVEPFLMHAEISKPGPVQPSGLKGTSIPEGKLMVQLGTGPIEVNISQSAVDTAVKTALSWHTCPEQLLALGQAAFVYTSYLIFNDTQCPLQYGQYKTKENLSLPAHSFAAYSWRTHLVRPAHQRLKFWFAGETRRSAQVNLDLEEESQTSLSIPFGRHNFYFILSISNIGSHREIRVKGAHQVRNNLPYPVQVTLQPRISDSFPEYLTVSPHGGWCSFALPSANASSNSDFSPSLMPSIQIRPAPSSNMANEWNWSSPVGLSFPASKPTRTSTSLTRVTRKHIPSSDKSSPGKSVDGKCFWLVKKFRRLNVGQSLVSSKYSSDPTSRLAPPPASPLLAPTDIYLHPLAVLSNDTGFPIDCRSISLLDSILTGEDPLRHIPSEKDVAMLALHPATVVPLDLDPLSHPQLYFSTTDNASGSAWSSPPFSFDMRLVDEIQEWESALYAATKGASEEDTEDIEHLLTIARKKTLSHVVTIPQLLSESYDESQKGKEKLAEDEMDCGTSAISVPLRIVASLYDMAHRGEGERHLTPTIRLALSFAEILSNETAQYVYFRRQLSSTQDEGQGAQQYIKLGPRRRIGFDFAHWTSTSVDDRGTQVAPSVSNILIQIGLNEDEECPGSRIAWSSPFRLNEKQLKTVSVLFPSSLRFSQFLLSIQPPNLGDQREGTPSTRITIRSRYCLINRSAMTLALKYQHYDDQYPFEKARLVVPDSTLLLNGFHMVDRPVSMEASGRNSNPSNQSERQPLLAFCVSTGARPGQDYGWSQPCSLTQLRDRGHILVPQARLSEEPDEDLPPPLLLTYAVKNRDGAIAVIIWLDAFPPFRLINNCPFGLHYAQHTDDRRKLELSRCQLRSGQTADFVWTWPEALSATNSEKISSETEEEEYEKEARQSQQRTDDIFEPKNFSANRLCIRTSGSGWSQEFPLDRPFAQTLALPHADQRTLLDPTRQIFVRVAACGPTNVIYFEQPTNDAETLQITAADSQPDVTRERGLTVEISAPLVSLSLLVPPDEIDWIDATAVPTSTAYHTLVEAVNASLDEVRMTFTATMITDSLEEQTMNSMTKTRVHALSLSIASFQVDNHMPFFDFPVVAISKATPSSSLSTISSTPVITLSTERAFYAVRKEKSTNQIYGKWFMEDLQLRFGKGIIVNIEDAFVERLVSTLRSVAPRYSELQRKNSTWLNAKDTNEKAATTWVDAEVNIEGEDSPFIEETMAIPFFLRKLHISKLDLEVTIHAKVALSLGLAHTPLSFDEIYLRSISCSPRRLLEAIAARYVADSLFQTPAVLGSLELLGNPTVLVNSVAIGIYDFFALPASGAKDGTSAICMTSKSENLHHERIQGGVLGFMTGLGRGVTSLVKHLSEGTLTSVSDLSSSLMRNVDNLSLDREYVRYNKMRLRNAPEQVHIGLARGLQGLGEGVIDGAMGLVAHPIAGLSDGGITGAVKGLGVGVMGAISKPLSGAVGLLTQTSQGALGSAGLGRFRLHQRHHMPKALPPADNSRMKYIVKIFEERKQHEQTPTDGREELRTPTATESERREEPELFIHAIDATLTAVETGSHLSANLVLSNLCLYVVVHDAIRNAVPLRQIVSVKESMQDGHKKFSLTLRQHGHDSLDTHGSASQNQAQGSTLNFVLPKRSARSAFLVQLNHLLSQH